MIRKAISFFEEYLVVDGRFRYFRLYSICLPAFIPTAFLLYMLYSGFFTSLEGTIFENVKYAFMFAFGLFGSASLLLIVVVGAVQIKYISKLHRN
jgi:hypothetical protein